MGNEKMSNLPGTPGWIARNNGKKYAETQTETENIEKEAGAKDVVGKLSFGSEKNTFSHCFRIEDEG